MRPPNNGQENKVDLDLEYEGLARTRSSSTGIISILDRKQRKEKVELRSIIKRRVLLARDIRHPSILPYVFLQWLSHDAVPGLLRATRTGTYGTGTVRTGTGRNQVVLVLFEHTRIVVQNQRGETCCGYLRVSPIPQERRQPATDATTTTTKNTNQIII
jgi:hypothetical protein